MAIARPDANAMYQKLLENLNANPAFLAGFNSDYAGNVNNLYQGLASQLGGFDTQEAQARADYERNIQDLAAQRSRGVTSLRDRLASRGILQSTPAVQAEADLNSQFDTQQSNYGSALNNMLNQLTAGRTGAENQYNTGLMGLDQGLIGQAGQYISTKQQEESQRQLAQQQAAAAEALARQQAEAANRQIAALQQQPQIDTAAIARALTAYTAPPPMPPPYVAPQTNPYFNQPAKYGPGQAPKVQAGSVPMMTSSGSAAVKPGSITQSTVKPAAKNQFGFAQKLVGARY